MLIIISTFAYLFVLRALEPALKISEFKRWLEAQGVVVKHGARHWKLYGPGGQSTLPRHPSKEIKEGLRRAILKQLGL